MKESALKSEDRTRHGLEIDPTVLMENLGINGYRIDWDARTAYLGREGLQVLANRFGKKYSDKAEAIYLAGWWWKLENNS